MKKFACPSCGAEVVFKSVEAVYCVCSYCNSTLVRHDLDLEKLGEMAALPDDISPLQIGTEGEYNQKKFTIIGRLKAKWQDGVWNEWYLLMDDGSSGWLAEAQGEFMINFVNDSVISEDFKQLFNYFTNFKSNELRGDNVSKINLNVDGENFCAVDAKNVTYCGFEGELPELAIVGKTKISVDLVSHNSEFANVEIVEGNYQLFVGNYVEWNDLKLRNTRTLEGW